MQTHDDLLLHHRSRSVLQLQISLLQVKEFVHRLEVEVPIVVEDSEEVALGDRTEDAAMLEVQAACHETLCA